MRVKPATRTESISEYYFSTKLKQIDQMRKSGIDVINLGIGSPDLPPSRATLDKLCGDAVKDGIHGYQSYIGLPALRKAFANWYSKYFRVDLNPDNEILPLIGSKEGIMHISMTFVNPGDEVLVPDPGYPTYSSATRLAGGIVKTYDLKESNSWLPDFEAIEASDLGKVKLMWVNYPNMPTGTPASSILFDRLVAFGRKHNILICNDNPYSFILNNDYHSILASEGAGEIALELNSLSKSHNMAGWRIGMLAGNSGYISEVLKVKSNMDSGIFYAMQTAAAQALEAGDDWFESVNKIYIARRKKAELIMDILECQYDSKQTGMFLWGKIPGNFEGSGTLSNNILDSAGVFITPGFIFGKNGERFIRISLCSAEEVLTRALERISKFKQEN
ncbi:MAG: aminotransferase class I/II-fold pyridoxal phosphate-dependent enzyme [Bacteroidales bacterium]